MEVGGMPWSPSEVNGKVVGDSAVSRGMTVWKEGEDQVVKVGRPKETNRSDSAVEAGLKCGGLGVAAGG